MSIGNVVGVWSFTGVRVGPVQNIFDGSRTKKEAREFLILKVRPEEDLTLFCFESLLGTRMKNVWPNYRVCVRSIVRQQYDNSVTSVEYDVVIQRMDRTYGKNMVNSLMVLDSLNKPVQEHIRAHESFRRDVRAQLHAVLRTVLVGIWPADDIKTLDKFWKIKGKTEWKLYWRYFFKGTEFRRSRIWACEYGGRKSYPVINYSS